MLVHTLGHSTLTAGDFLSLLDTHGIATIADVRRYPASRRHPHFAREALADSLAATGRGYTWLPALGGRRSGRADSPHVAWQNAAFRAYADHMETAEFADGLAALLALAAVQPTAILCAEAVPWRCHRQLIADALVARGIEVRHILGAGTRVVAGEALLGEPHPPAPAAAHRLTSFARLVGERVVYDGGQLALGR